MFQDVKWVFCEEMDGLHSCTYIIEQYGAPFVGATLVVARKVSIFQQVALFAGGFVSDVAISRKVSIIQHTANGA